MRAILLLLAIIAFAAADTDPFPQELEEFKTHLVAIRTAASEQPGELTDASCAVWDALFHRLTKLEDEYMAKWTTHQFSSEQKEMKEAAVNEWEALRVETLGKVFFCGMEVQQKVEIAETKKTGRVFNAKGDPIDVTDTTPPRQYVVTKDPVAQNFHIFDEPLTNRPAVDGWQQFVGIAPYGGEYNTHAMPYYVQFCHESYLPPRCQDTPSDCLYGDLHADPDLQALCYKKARKAGPNCIHWHECIRCVNHYLDEKYGRPIEYDERVEIAYQMKNEILNDIMAGINRLNDQAAQDAIDLSSKLADDSRTVAERIEDLQRRVSNERELSEEARRLAVGEMPRVRQLVQEQLDHLKRKSMFRAEVAEAFQRILAANATNSTAASAA